MKKLTIDYIMYLKYNTTLTERGYILGNNIRYASPWDKSIEECIKKSNILPTEQELNQCLTRHYNLDYDLEKLVSANAISKEMYEKYFRLNNLIQKAVCAGTIDKPDVYQEYLLRQWKNIVRNSTLEELRSICKNYLSSIKEPEDIESKEHLTKVC